MLPCSTTRVHRPPSLPEARWRGAHLWPQHPESGGRGIRSSLTSATPWVPGQPRPCVLSAGALLGSLGAWLGQEGVAWPAPLFVLAVGGLGPRGRRRPGLCGQRRGRARGRLGVQRLRLRRGATAPAPLSGLQARGVPAPTLCLPLRRPLGSPRPKWPLLVRTHADVVSVPENKLPRPLRAGWGGHSPRGARRRLLARVNSQP